MRRQLLAPALLVPLLLAACGSSNAGTTCNPDAASPCDEGLVCAQRDGENLCLHPYGAECDASAKDAFCQGDATCTETADGAQCLVPDGGACDPTDAGECAADLTCAEVQGDESANACRPKVLLTGRVFDAASGQEIAGAHVIALDGERVAVSDVAVSAQDGTYSLEVPAVRDADGRPLASETFTLRADADGYQAFPGGLRQALPISAADATSEDGAWMIATAATDVALLALPAEAVGHRVEGRVDAGSASAGVLVVGTVDGTSRSTVTDASGAYTLFDVPDGAVTVKGYAAGLQLVPAEATMAGADVEGVDLTKADTATSTVSGSIQIVNAGGGAATSVVLVVADTFDEVTGRGEVPPGLRAPRTGTPDVTGAFTIEDVPDGTYVVLAAFENDGLVRDPDPNISGTQVVTLTVPDATQGNEITLGSSFKVTGALAVIAPGADTPEVVGATPTFRWADDSSEDYYTLEVYDAFGNVIWEVPNVPGVSGSDEVDVTYDGPPLESGMYYQFRATSWRGGGGGKPAGPISTTEELRGVFVVD